MIIVWIRWTISSNVRKFLFRALLYKLQLKTKSIRIYSLIISGSEVDPGNFDID